MSLQKKASSVRPTLFFLFATLCVISALAAPTDLAKVPMDPRKSLFPDGELPKTVQGTTVKIAEPLWAVSDIEGQSPEILITELIPGNEAVREGATLLSGYRFREALRISGSFRQSLVSKENPALISLMRFSNLNPDAKAGRAVLQTSSSSIKENEWVLFPKDSMNLVFSTPGAYAFGIDVLALPLEVGAAATAMKASDNQPALLERLQYLFAGVGSEKKAEYAVQKVSGIPEGASILVSRTPIVDPNKVKPVVPFKPDSDAMWFVVNSNGGDLPDFRPVLMAGDEKLATAGTLTFLAIGAGYKKLESPVIQNLSVRVVPSVPAFSDSSIGQRSLGMYEPSLRSVSVSDSFESPVFPVRWYEIIGNVDAASLVKDKCAIAIYRYAANPKAAKDLIPGSATDPGRPPDTILRKLEGETKSLTFASEKTATGFPCITLIRAVPVSLEYRGAFSFSFGKATNKASYAFGK
jgi:hypothetical protein